MRFIIIVLIIAGITAAAIVTFMSIGDRTQDTVTPITVTRDSVIADLTGFVYDSLTPNAIFYASQTCQESTCVPELNNTDVAHAYPILLLRLQADATGDSAMRASADAAMDLVLAECKQSQAVCADNFAAIDAYYELTGDTRYRDAITSAGAYVLADAATQTSPEHLQTGHYRKLEMLFGLTNDLAYRVPIILAAESALASWPTLEGDALYTANDLAVTASMPFAVNGLFLPAYRITGERAFLEPVLDFIARADIEKNLSAFRSEAGMGTLLNAVHAAQEVSTFPELTDDERTRARELANVTYAEIIGWQYDSSERPLVTGENNLITGMHENAASLDAIVTKNLNLNAMTAYLLSKYTSAPPVFELYAY